MPAPPQPVRLVVSEGCDEAKLLGKALVENSPVERGGGNLVNRMFRSLVFIHVAMRRKHV